GTLDAPRPPAAAPPSSGPRREATSESPRPPGAGPPPGSENTLEPHLEPESRLEATSNPNCRIKMCAECVPRPIRCQVFFVRSEKFPKSREETRGTAMSS